MSIPRKPFSLDTLIAREAIHDLNMVYCRAVDLLDEELLGTVYHEGAIDDHGFWSGDAREFAKVIVPLMRENCVASRHVVANEYVVVDGEKAEGEIVVLAYRTLRKRPDQLTMVSARYLDAYERRSGVWGIVRRTVVRDVWDDVAFAEPTGDAFSASDFVHGTRDRKDPSYQLSLLAQGGPFESEG